MNGKNFSQHGDADNFNEIYIWCKKMQLRPFNIERIRSAPDFTLQTGLFCNNRPKGKFIMTRFMNKNIHAYLDYPVALGLIAMPFVLGLGNINPLAFWLSVSTGIAALVLTFFTDHHLGVVRVLPYKLHLAVDLMVGLAFLAAPFVLGFAGVEAAYFWIIGVTVLTVVGLDKPEQTKLAMV